MQIMSFFGAKVSPGTPFKNIVAESAAAGNKPVIIQKKHKNNNT